MLGTRERLDRQNGDRRPSATDRIRDNAGHMGALYDRIGTGYTKVRGEDPRIAAAIHAALGDARTVVNVGAGAGSYEPRDREVIAVEPSEVMIAQRPPGAAPAVQATAEALPFADGEFDAAMAVLSDHHWPDAAAGLREMRRVAAGGPWSSSGTRRARCGWLVRDYLTTFRAIGLTAAEVAGHVGARHIEPVPIPHDCRDGFFTAYWRRPHAYLDPRGARRDLGVPAAARRRRSTTRWPRLRARPRLGRVGAAQRRHPRARRAGPRLPAGLLKRVRERERLGAPRGGGRRRRPSRRRSPASGGRRRARRRPGRRAGPRSGAATPSESSEWPA